MSCVTVNDALSYFYDIIFAVIADSVPIVKLKSSHKFPSWYNSELISLIKDKEHARKLFIRAGRDKNSDAYRSFSSLRADVKALQKACHADFVRNVSEDIKANPKRFWTYVKSLKSSSSLPKVMTLNSFEYTSVKEIVQAFCKYFESMFSVNDNNISFSCYPMCDTPLFQLPKVSPAQMKKEILALDRNTCCGYDKVSAVFLIECADSLCFPLSTIFNMSVEKCEYPSLLKMNNIVPIYKMKGDKSCIESYRPISIQPVVSKLFERIVNRALRAHLRLLICDEQHGFLPSKSTTTNLLCYSDFITSALDDGVQVHSIYTDFQKAFDTVSHNLLLHKMEHFFGIRGDDLRWFYTYLCDRHQRVTLQGMESDWVPVTSGVPQGSILGPSLFIMYMNDLPSHLRHSQCLLFADDVKIFKRISCLDDCLELQADLNSLSEWCSKWKMKLNFTKCFFINFSLKRVHDFIFDYTFDNNPISRVPHIKDLGIYFSSNMSFSLHINTVVNRALRMLGFVRRTMKPFNDVKLLKVLYNSYVRSSLDYCSSVWCPSSKLMIDKIERVQKRFVKHLCFHSNINYSSDDYVSLCNHFQLTTLNNRRKVADMVLFYKILHSRINCFSLVSKVLLNVPTRRTRHTNVFATAKKCRLLLRKNDFVPRCVSLANSLKTFDFFNSYLCHLHMKRMILVNL